jgi:hypothetical protein
MCEFEEWTWIIPEYLYVEEIFWACETEFLWERG